jgi:undecaprenyl-diphosphatase
MAPGALVPSRRVLRGLVVLSWLVALVLGAHYTGTAQPGTLDSEIATWVHATFGDRDGAAPVLIWTSTPRVVYAVIAATALVGLLRRKWEFAALAVVGPAVVVGLVELVGKPLVDRRMMDILCYPSGHTASAVSALTVAGLGFAGGSGLARRLLALAVWLAGTCAVGLGLIAMDYHYPTDVVGAVAVVLGTVLPLAALADAAAARRRPSALAARQ